MSSYLISYQNIVSIILPVYRKPGLNWNQNSWILFCQHFPEEIMIKLWKESCGKRSCDS